MDIPSLIREAVRNALLLKSVINAMIDDIQKAIPTKITRGQTQYEVSPKSRHSLEFLRVAEDSYEAMEKVIVRYVPVFDRNGYVMSFKKQKIGNTKWVDDGTDLGNLQPIDGFTANFFLSFKDKTTVRIKPARYVYHFSKSENRDGISKQGLQPRPWGDGSNWTHVPNLKYEPAVFAVNTEDGMWGYRGWDKWRIDTAGLPNKWWQDLNFHDRKDLVMTFDPIPPEHLRRIA